MVFPPYRKPADRNLRQGPPGPRRDPQLDLAELNEQVDPARLRVESFAGGAFDEIPTLTQVVQVPGREAAVPTEPGRPGVDFEEILQRLLRRSDGLLDAQLQQALAPAVERAAGIVARELRDSLEGIVREVIARAITEELARLLAEATENSRLPRRS